MKATACEQRAKGRERSKLYVHVEMQLFLAKERQGAIFDGSLSGRRIVCSGTLPGAAAEQHQNGENLQSADDHAGGKNQFA